MVEQGVPWLRGWHYRVTLPTLSVLLAVATPVSAQNTFPTTGNVGIGTTSPSAPLQIFGNNTSVPAIFGSAGHTRFILTTPDAAYNPKLQLPLRRSYAWGIDLDDGYGAVGPYVDDG